MITLQFDDWSFIHFFMMRLWYIYMIDNTTVIGEFEFIDVQTQCIEK